MIIKITMTDTYNRDVIVRMFDCFAKCFARFFTTEFLLVDAKPHQLIFEFGCKMKVKRVFQATCFSQSLVLKMTMLPFVICED